MFRPCGLFKEIDEASRNTSNPDCKGGGSAGAHARAARPGADARNCKRLQASTRRQRAERSHYRAGGPDTARVDEGCSSAITAVCPGDASGHNRGRAPADCHSPVARQIGGCQPPVSTGSACASGGSRSDRVARAGSVPPASRSRPPRAASGRFRCTNATRPERRPGSGAIAFVDYVAARRGAARVAGGWHRIWLA